MAQGARVSSLEALKTFKAALQRFIAQTDKALCEADVERQRVQDWLAHDRPTYWQHELKKREDAMARARDDLRRIQLSIADRPPSAIEQKQALKKAQRRWEEAREKIQIVTRWQHMFERVTNEYRGQTQHILGSIDSDLPKAVAMIDRLSDSLDSYVAVAAPDTEVDRPSEGVEEIDAPSMARPVEPRLEVAPKKPATQPEEREEDPAGGEA